MKADLVSGAGELPEGLGRVVEETLARGAAELGLAETTLALRFVDDAEMARLNGRWRGKERTTDVLSFPIEVDEPGDELHLGDIAICLPVAERQAALAGHTLAQEVGELALHGLLHLVGYDHESDDGEMAALELRLRPRVVATGETR